jgi:hypothetical protein
MIRAKNRITKCRRPIAGSVSSLPDARQVLFATRTLPRLRGGTTAAIERAVRPASGILTPGSSYKKGKVIERLRERKCDRTER